jgi:hypothetical protein
MTERMPPGLASRQMMTTKWTKRMARSRMLACYQNVQIALDLGKFRNSPWTGQCSRAIVCLGIRWAIGQIAPGPSGDRIDHSPKLNFRLSHLVQSASESFLRTLTVDGNPCDVPSAFDERKIFIDRHSWLVRIKCKSAQDCLRSSRTTRPVFDSEWQDRDIAQGQFGSVATSGTTTRSFKNAAVPHKPDSKATGNGVIGEIHSETHGRHRAEGTLRPHP